MKPPGWLELLFAAILVFLAIFVPFFINGYWLSIGVTSMMYIALSTSWALFSGPTHYISLATGAASQWSSFRGNSAKFNHVLRTHGSSRKYICCKNSNYRHFQNHTSHHFFPPLENLNLGSICFLHQRLNSRPLQIRSHSTFEEYECLRG